MDSLLLILPIVGVVACLMLSFFVFKRCSCAKKAIKTNFIMFAVVSLVIGGTSFVAFASPSQEDQVAIASQELVNSESSSDGMIAIAAALAVGLGAIGGGIAVASAAPAAIGATSEDPKAFSKSIIFVALGEGIAIYGLIIAILLVFKL